MRKLKVGIIGAGQIAEMTHIPNYFKYLEFVETVSVMDVNLDRAKYIAEKFHIPYYFSNYEEMLEKLELDAVSVCTPNKFHAEAAIAALNSGCHVLCEKPPAVSADEAERMTQAAKENGKILTYNFHFRYSEEIQAIKKFIVAEELGDVYAAKIEALRRRGIPGWGAFINKEIQGGGPLIDIGVHMLDAALYLMGYPEVDYVSASTYRRIGDKAGVGLMGSWDPKQFTVEDSAFGYIRFKNSASILFQTSFALNMKERSIMNVHLFGEKAGASVFPPAIYTEKHGNLLDIELPFLQEADRHSKSIRHFIEACLGNEAVLCTAEEGLMIQRIIDAIYRSAEIGQAVKL
ncbi:Predicted dehydrogenase [Geosporobacter subterraneus DSM 17957]|uniref:Predicted dehydrogenase n=1 Tax=Geosporobacter subterraneus DSM 17957 TaxID=1121919 RepID=A0A1M6MMR4_9FIRM|nr:Gfo/Idh/MocA family oxidoreductase [Geosporobacter subterraneus]SHJ84785.1 Predicted dehydrogenase [Geosporobacter subterraneus DSM 17957]